LGILEFLLKEKLNLEVSNKNGNTPLHLAAEMCKLEVVELLLKSGSKLEAKNVDGNTPLLLSVTSSDNRCQFHKHFTQNFFVQKCFAQLFSNYSLAL